VGIGARKSPWLISNAEKTAILRLRTTAMFFLGFVLYSSTVLISAALAELLVHGATGREWRCRQAEQ